MIHSGDIFFSEGLRNLRDHQVNEVIAECYGYKDHSRSWYYSS